MVTAVGTPRDETEITFAIVSSAAVLVVHYLASPPESVADTHHHVMYILKLG